MEAIKIATEVSPERIADLLCAGFEGGSYGVGYWCRIMEYQDPPPIADAYRANEYPPDLTILGPRYTDWPLLGGAVICRRYEEETDEEWTPLVLDGAAIARGLRLMMEKHPRHWAAFLTEQEDAATGDVFIQLCLLGEVEYG